MQLTVHIQAMPEQPLFGLWKKTSDQTMSKDIPSLSKAYLSAVGKVGQTVLPFYVITRNYVPETGKAELFIGSHMTAEPLERFVLSKGLYLRAVVRPKWGFLWGAAIGEAKRYVYQEWLPHSAYRERNLEYEYHTEKSVGRRPEIDLFFAISPKE